MGVVAGLCLNQSIYDRSKAGQKTLVAVIKLLVAGNQSASGGRHLVNGRTPDIFQTKT